MSDKERYFNWHCHSISKNVRRPIFKRILLLLVFVLISSVIFVVGSQDEWKRAELILVLFQWVLLIPVVADANGPFWGISYCSLLYLLYLAVLCLVTTFFLRICKSSGVGKIAALVVPIAIQLSGVGFLILGHKRFLSSLISKRLLYSLLALGLVLAYRTLDWCLAQNVERKRQ